MPGPLTAFLTDTLQTVQRRINSAHLRARTAAVVGGAAAIAAPLLLAAWLASGRFTVTPPDDGPFDVIIATGSDPSMSTTETRPPVPSAIVSAPTVSTGTVSAGTVSAGTVLPTTTVGAAPPTTDGTASSTGIAQHRVARAFELPPVDRGAALPGHSESRVVPIGMQMSTIDVSRYAIREIGLEDDGALEIPGASEIGWYRYGATAGSPGATVLAAHVTWNGRTGPFFELGTVEPGTEIELQLGDGTARWYRVVERAIYPKDELPRERIWRTSGQETLVLITCGGDFNRNVRAYRQNIVVYAVPTDAGR